MYAEVVVYCMAKSGCLTIQLWRAKQSFNVVALIITHQVNLALCNQNYHGSKTCPHALVLCEDVRREGDGHRAPHARRYNPYLRNAGNKPAGLGTQWEKLEVLAVRLFLRACIPAQHWFHQYQLRKVIHHISIYIYNMYIFSNKTESEWQEIKWFNNWSSVFCLTDMSCSGLLKYISGNLSNIIGNASN